MNGVVPRRTWLLTLALLAFYVPLWVAALADWPLDAVVADHFILAMKPRFADMVSLLSALDCHRAGFDVMPRDPCDPLGRPLNTPRLWLQLSRLDIGAGDAPVLGVALGAAVLAALVRWLAPVSAIQAILALLLLISPPIVLGVERANVDLLLLLVVLAAVLLLVQRLRLRLLGYTLIFAAFALKLFPVFALGRIAAEPPVLRRWIGLAAAVATTAYLWWIRQDLIDIAAVVPQMRISSFGASVLPIYAALEGLIPPAWVRPAGMIVGVSAAATGAILGRNRLAAVRDLPPVATAGLEAGGLIYVGTYMLGTNFDYRLIFVLLCWPAWLTLSISDHMATRRAGRCAIVLTLASFWLSSTPLMFDDVLLLVLVGVCSSMLAARLLPGRMIRNV